MSAVGRGDSRRRGVIYTRACYTDMAQYPSLANKRIDYRATPHSPVSWACSWSWAMDGAGGCGGMHRGPGYDFGDTLYSERQKSVVTGSPHCQRSFRCKCYTELIARVSSRLVGAVMQSCNAGLRRLTHVGHVGHVGHVTISLPTQARFHSQLSTKMMASLVGRISSSRRSMRRELRDRGPGRYGNAAHSIPLSGCNWRGSRCLDGVWLRIHVYTYHRPNLENLLEL